MSVPKEIRENIARAKGYLRRDELPRAMETLSLALREVGNSQIMRAGRFEIEVHFEEFLNELIRHPHMQPLLDPQQTGTPRNIPYQRGKEGVLATVLEGLGKILRQSVEQQEKNEQAQDEQRRKDLMITGLQALRQGDIGRGRAFMKRAAVEFGQKPGTLFEIGQLMASANQYVDAAEMFEKAFELDTKDAESYSNAVSCYIQAMEFEKAEGVFRKILRQFGGHASTYARMASMYLMWHKRMKAEEFAIRALQVDKDNTEAQEILRKIERR